MITFLILFLGISFGWIFYITKEFKKRKIILSKIEEIKKNYNRGNKVLYPLFYSLAQEAAKLGSWSKEKYEKALNYNIEAIELIEIFLKEEKEHRALYTIDKLKEFYI